MAEGWQQQAASIVYLICLIIIFVDELREL